MKVLQTYSIILVQTTESQTTVLPRSDIRHRESDYSLFPIPYLTYHTSLALRVITPNQMSNVQLVAESVADFSVLRVTVTIYDYQKGR